MTPLPAAGVGFKTIFWTVVAMTAAAFFGNLYLTTRPVKEQTDLLKEMVHALDGIMKTGFGGILGLLVGKQA
jgi:hypothetical protein